ncbi:MAG: hypothetical protein KF724_03700 [Phycisphaeraceae bacterium]|nr:hypothetical protein [Phycisphaeraceae bacterium]
MPLLLGIDEAGYGPLLGPLCVGWVLAEVPSADFAPSGTNSETGGASTPATSGDLWTTLGSAICRRPRDPRGRIAVDDSKRLKRPNDAAGHPLEHLERGVLGWLACLDGRCALDAPAAFPVDDGALLSLLGAAPPDAAPWSTAPTPLPLANDRALLGIAAKRLQRALADSGVALRALRVNALDVPAFNAAFERTRSKASVNTAMGLEVVHAVSQQHSNDDLIVAFDRHGGRVHYREELAYTFPEASLRVLEESDAGSRYELDCRHRRITVSWQSEAESKHLTVALASMGAKLVRELWMRRLNTSFSKIMPELKPTAGYVEDGRRWLAEVEPHLARLGLDRRRLVRMA